MKEQERAASEEAEKRLKAALLTKREPTIASRVASPSIGASAHSETQPEPNGKQAGEEQSPEETTMDVDHVSQTSISNSPEVGPLLPVTVTSSFMMRS